MFLTFNSVLLNQLLVETDVIVCSTIKMDE